MSCGLMFGDIIVNIPRNKKLKCHDKEDDCFLINIEENNIFMYRWSLQNNYWNKGTYKCLDIPCAYFCIKRNDMKHYLTKILKATLQLVI